MNKKSQVDLGFQIFGGSVGASQEELASKNKPRHPGESSEMNGGKVLSQKPQNESKRPSQDIKVRLVPGPHCEEKRAVNNATIKPKRL